MTPAQLLTVTAAGALLLVASYVTQRAVTTDEEGDDGEPDWTDEIDASISTARSLIAPTPADTMQPSKQLVDVLKASESLRLERYRLGDGGWTNGYGHYWPDGGALPPERITLDEAEAQFVSDLEERGARWVRTYVTVPLTQHQFDALVSMAFNLSPRSFRTIANAVNAGEDPEDAALRYVRAGTNLEQGLRNRRAREVAMYRTGTYA
jgi:lysozyme